MLGAIDQFIFTLGDMAKIFSNYRLSVQ